MHAAVSLFIVVVVIHGEPLIFSRVEADGQTEEGRSTDG